MSEQVNVLRRRRSELANRAALYGINTPPEISIELRDIEEALGFMDRIDIHRRNLAHLSKQIDSFGAHVPMHISNQAKHEREQIAQLKAFCAKKRYHVADAAVDFEEPQSEHAPVSAPLPEDPIVAVRERLRDLEALIRNDLKEPALRLLRDLQSMLES